MGREARGSPAGQSSTDLQGPRQPRAGSQTPTVPSSPREAGSIGTNPVIIRKILTQLQGAGLIKVLRGTGGIELTRELKDISFYDVYQAIEPVEDGDLFRFHENPSPQCPVGRNIHALLDDKLKAIQESMETEMKKYTLADLRTGMQEILAKEA